MKYEIRNRWSGAAQFTAEIACAEDTPISTKIGLALKWGYESGAVLRGAVLRDADLRDADLRDANLRDADLSGADLSGVNVPFIENIDAKILASIEANKAAGTNGLDMGGWHGPMGEPLNETNWCNTTHCRAGYAVCVAGKEGFELERALGGNTQAAAILLYLKSSPGEPVPDFFCSNAKAMADMTARAAKYAKVTP